MTTLKAYREKTGTTLKQIADRIEAQHGIRLTTVFLHYIETGQRTCRLRNALAIRDACDGEVDVLTLLSQESQSLLQASITTS